MSIGELFEKKQANNFMLLRLVAALLVIYGHSYAIMGQVGPDAIQNLIKLKFAGGVAVDIFFLISGFLITASWLHGTPKSFLSARVLRIFPALIVCVAVSTFILGPIFTNHDNYFSQPETWSYFFHNASLWSTKYNLPGVFLQNHDHGVNGSLWSLPLEFRLYLLVFVLGLLKLLYKSTYFPFIVIFSLLFSAYGLKEYLNIYDNWVGSSIFFAIGIFIWIYRYQIALNETSLAVVLLLSIAFLGTQYFQHIYYLLITSVTFFIAFYIKLPVIKNLDLSYGLYLYGWPIQQVLASQFPDSSPAFNCFTAILVATLFAYFSWKYIEKPSLELKKYFKSTNKQ